jgi:hypothetical protein
VTFDEFVDQVYALIPDAFIAQDNDGQLIIYTNKSRTESGELAEFIPPGES